MIQKMVQFSIARPKTIWLLTVLVLAISIWQALHLQQDGRIEALIHPDNPTITLRNEMEKHFGASTFIILGTRLETWTPASISETERLANLLATAPIVKEVHSIFSKNYLETSADGFESKPIVSQGAEGRFDAQAILRNLQSDPIYRGNLLGLQKDAIPLLVEFHVGTTDQEATEWVEQSLTELEVQQNWAVSGLPVIQHEMKRFMDRDMGVLVPLFVVAILVLLYISFRSWQGVLVPLAPIVVAVIATYGLMGALGIKITMVTNLVPMLLIAIGAACSIHFINQYFRELAENEAADVKSIVYSSGSHIGRVIFLAALTTVLGFLSNIFNPVTAIRDFAIALAFGVAVIFVLNVTLVPSILAALKRPAANRSGINIGWFNRILDRTLTILCRLVLRRYALVSVLGILSATVCLVGIWQLKVESSGLSFFKDDSALVTQSRALSQDFGGVVGFDIAIDSQQIDGLKRADVLNTIADFTDWLKQTYHQDIQVTLSVADYISQMARAYNGTAGERYQFQSNEEVHQYLEVYGWKADLEEDLRNVVDKDFRFARLTGRFALAEHPDGSYRESSLQEQKRIIEAAQLWLSEHLPDTFKVQPFGEMMIATEVNDSIIRGQITSLVLALVAVFSVVAIAFRSAQFGLLSLVPVLIAVGINFGLMGLLGIPLNIATALVSTMAIGIGIDDAIHFITTYRQRLAQTQQPAEALIQTFAGAGRAVIYTTLALVGGYLIMLASQFTPVVYFGFLNIVTIISATVATLVVLPSLLLWSQSKFAGQISNAVNPIKKPIGENA